MGELDEIEIEGILVQHWEVFRFVVPGPPRLWGLMKTVEKWLPQLLPNVLPPIVRRGPARYFRMRARGRVGPVGHFGHKGICSREFFVSAVLSCEETSSPGVTW